jgi:hypothetical protein
MIDDFIDNKGNIKTPEGDTYTLQIKLTKGSPWQDTDKVLIEVDRKNLGDQVYQKLYDLAIDEENPSVAYCYFRMSSSDAKRIPAGFYIWSYTVYLNCRREGVEILGDEEVTPFGGSRKYEVVEVASNGRD